MFTITSLHVRTGPLLAAFLLLTLLACRDQGSRKKEPEIVRIDKLTGPGFSMKVPEGYVHRPDILKELGQPDAKAVWQEKPGDYPNPFLGSLVVVPVGPLPGKAAEETIKYLDDPENCVKEFEAIPLQKTTRISEGLPPGVVCQVRGEVRGGDQQAVILTLMKQPGKNSAWVLTCNHDPRDVNGPSACAKALEGWEFIP